jgi:hypothetical protein
MQTQLSLVLDLRSARQDRSSRSGSTRLLRTSANTPASLWGSSGTRLARVTFTNETASGWQIGRLSKPVAVAAARTYVAASYHTDTGHYAQLEGAFAGGATIGNSTMAPRLGSIDTARAAIPGALGTVLRISSMHRLCDQTTHHRLLRRRRHRRSRQVPRPPQLPRPPQIALARQVQPLARNRPPDPQPHQRRGPTTTTTATATPTSQPTGPGRRNAPSDGAFVWSNLAACGWPAPSNSGYQLSACPSGLSENVSDTSPVIRVTAPNTRIECQNIVGGLSIEASNVIISNVKIACTSGRTGEATNGTAVIYVDDGASATIDRVQINGMSGVHSCIWRQRTSMTARAVNCYKVNDGVFSWSDKSYSQTTGDTSRSPTATSTTSQPKPLTDMLTDTRPKAPANGLVRHNTYLMTSGAQKEANSAIAIWNSLRSSHDIVVQDNPTAGGGFSVYAEDYSPSESSPAGGFAVTDISLSDNVFSTRLFGCVGDYGVWYPRGRPTDGWQRQGNTLLETGANLDTSNPTYPGRVCN